MFALREIWEDAPEFRMQRGLRSESVAQRFPLERWPKVSLRFDKADRSLVTTRFYSQNFHIQEFRLPRRQLCCPSRSQDVSIPKMRIARLWRIMTDYEIYVAR